jgi:hypothetical protein
MNRAIERIVSIGLFAVSVLLWIIAVYLMFQE